MFGDTNLQFGDINIPGRDRMNVFNIVLFWRTISCKTLGCDVNQTSKADITDAVSSKIDSGKVEIKIVRILYCDVQGS